MTEEELLGSKLAKRVLKQYAKSHHNYLYEMDVKPDLPFVQQRVAVLSTWDASLNTFGLVNRDMAVIADNNYISSLAYNLSLIFIARAIEPDTLDYDDILVGNFKRYFAEQRYSLIQDADSIRYMIEYLYEYDHLNRDLLKIIAKDELAREQLSLLGKMSGHFMMVHEIAHLVYGRGGHISDEATHMKAVSMPRIDSFVREYFPQSVGDETNVLYEEIFCDLFAVINLVGDFGKLGWDRTEIARCLFSLHISSFCLFFARSFVANEDEGVTDLSRHDLMIRHQCVAHLVEEDLRSMEVSKGKGVGFETDTNEIMSAFVKASKFPVKTEQIRRMSSLIADGFIANGIGAFDHVMREWQQTFKVSNKDFIDALKL